MAYFSFVEFARMTVEVYFSTAHGFTICASQFKVKHYFLFNLHSQYYFLWVLKLYYEYKIIFITVNKILTVGR